MLSFFKCFQKKDGDGKPKSAWVILIAAALGIALLLLGAKGVGTQKEAAILYSPDEDELTLYQTHLEARIATLCQSVSGVSDVRVFVTLEGGFESVYATEYEDGDEHYVIVGGGSSAEPLYLSRRAPTVKGIGIVCHGGSDPTVQRELTELISATLDLPRNRIYVTEAG